MTRSPLQAANHRTQTNDRHAKAAHDQRVQRERLTKQVMQRQDNESTTMPAVEVPAAASLTPEQMYSNFEEWIKMCTDNKVNANNSWNFALIDYFHEMTFLRDGDSINFQKASCTLDGCVKIYTSRVDSVASETGKLLSGLADSATSGDVDDDAHRGDGTDRRTRRKGRSDVTLLKDFSSIALKKFDLDFTVDPLFKKTSADFDEGGARGLLLNHLSIDRDGKIIFDASDASNTDHAQNDDGELLPEDDEHNDKQQEETSDDKDESADTNKDLDKDNEELTEKSVEDTAIEDPMDVDEQPANTGDQPENADQQVNVKTEINTEHENTAATEDKAQDSLVEISRLRAKLPPVEVLSELRICPTLQGYNFFSDTDMNMPDLENAAEQLENPVEPQPSNNYDDYDDMDMFDYGDDAPILDGIEDVPFMDDDNDEGNANKEQDDEDGHLQETDFMSAMIGGDSGDMFSYFDATFGKNWAGPEHWKLRRPVSKAREKDGSNQDEDKEGGEKPRKQKQAFQINFLEGDDVDEDVLFATDKRTKVSMSSVQEAAAEDDLHLLPNDMHFSSKQLLKLFLKPAAMRSRKKQKQRAEAERGSVSQQDDQQYDYDPGMDDYDAGPDTQYWADQQAESSPDVPETPATDTQADQTVLTALDDTSYYQDYYDTYDDAENSHLYGDALITNHRLKKVKPLYVNYARTAKRVDVKRLKDNIWKALTLAKADSSPPNENANMDMVSGIQRFTDILQELRKMYTAKAMKDISVPFCFICLLHLANERNLTISRPTGDGGMADDDDPDDFVLGETPMDERFLNEITIAQNV
ncbi:condensin complex subunit 2/barren [Fennellomyces sp. T-0311]|nr:condensin complex subunit 2/barren [Fennellomyces sp. T-0311]